MIASTLTRFTIRIHRLLDIVGLSDDQITLVQGSNGGGARDVGSCAHFASPKLADTTATRSADNVTCSL